MRTKHHFGDMPCLAKNNEGPMLVERSMLTMRIERSTCLLTMLVKRSMLTVRIERSICPLTMLVERSMLTMRIERSICPLTMLVERSMVRRRLWSFLVGRAHKVNN